MTLRLYAFNCGWFQCRPGFFIDGEEGDYIRSPVPAYLIEHPKGKVLFDTGLGERYRKTPETMMPENKFGLQTLADMEIAARLRGADIDPASINWIVNSHLHADHCGGNPQIPNATIIVQRREFEAAEETDNPALYHASEYDPGHPVKKIDGEYDLFGDGTIRIIPTYGHTPGHQSVIVTLPKGEVLLAADCCYTEANLQRRAMPQFSWDIGEGLKTLDRLKDMEAKGVRILFGHDARQWKSVREAEALD